LLERRPDIAAAERRLEAANARIGVAKAAFYPLLNLTADASFVANDIGKLFAWSARTWALGPLAGLLLVQPIFDGGRNAANLERAQAALSEETALYRQQILRAVREVEDALVALRTLAEQHDTVANTLAASTRAQQLAQQRFEAGETSYLEVLDAQRQVLLAERQTQQISGERQLATVALIRALGGGW
jgi:multidrug efflux system outer membrane protein